MTPLRCSKWAAGAELAGCAGSDSCAGLLRLPLCCSAPADGKRSGLKLGSMEVGRITRFDDWVKVLEVKMPSPLRTEPFLSASCGFRGDAVGPL